MDIREQCRHLCHHITTLTGVHTALLDIAVQDFIIPPFRHECDLQDCSCNAYRTHLFGAYEAERWDGKYIYYCPHGLVFIATPPLQIGAAIDCCIITGPFLMANADDDMPDDTFGALEPITDVPRLSTAQARSLSEMICAAVSSFAMESAPLDVDSGRQSAMLQMMYDLSTDQTLPHGYPIELERRLQEHIRSGDKEESQKLLNELLVYIYAACGNDLRRIAARVRDLLVLMSRAAIDGGADADELCNLCLNYEQQIDSFTGIEALNRWISAILHKFISFVFDFNDIKHQNVIYKTTAYIKEHLTEKLSLDQVAEQVYLSKSYFCRIIKDELGYSFTEYVNRLRIERSKTLLSSTSTPIADIAYAVGFDDQSYFTRIFKKLTGMAPGKFRESRTRSSVPTLHPPGKKAARG